VVELKIHFGNNAIPQIARKVSSGRRHFLAEFKNEKASDCWLGKIFKVSSAGDFYEISRIPPVFKRHPLQFDQQQTRNDFSLYKEGWTTILFHSFSFA
jgi:hypothetical protein